MNDRTITSNIIYKGSNHFTGVGVVNEILGNKLELNFLAKSLVVFILGDSRFFRSFTFQEVHSSEAFVIPIHTKLRNGILFIILENSFVIPKALYVFYPMVNDYA